MTAGGPAPARDPGLQPERTRLAWRRTGLTLTVVAVLVVRAAAAHGEMAAAAAAAVSTLAWAGVLLAIRRRSRALAATPRAAPAGPAVPATALAVLGYALAGLVLLALRVAG